MILILFFSAIDTKTLAKNKAILNDDYEKYEELEGMKSNQITAEMIEEYSRKIPERKPSYCPVMLDKEIQVEPDDMFFNDSDDSSATSLDDSIIDEYWEDFDLENKLKEEKKKMKFINLDDPFSADLQQMEKQEQNLFKNFDPENPPLLDYYEQLKRKYKLPSRKLLEMERDGYRKYIKMLKSVTRMLVKRAKAQARNTARKIVINHSSTARQKFDKEIINLLLQHEEVKNENVRYRKRILDLEKKIAGIELTLAQTSNYFRKREIDFDIYYNQSDSDETEEVRNVQNRRKGIRGIDGMTSDDKSNKIHRLDFNDLLISRPIDFYSFYIKISNEDKDVLIRDKKIQTLRWKIERQYENIVENKNELQGYSNEIERLCNQHKIKEEELQRTIDSTNLNAEIVKNNVQKDRDDRVFQMKQEVEKMAETLDLCKEIVTEEVSINESIRYKQKMMIHKLKDDINHLKRTMLIPRMHAQYLEENKRIQDMKKRGEFIPPDLEFYDVSSVRSTPGNKHHSISRNLNEK